MGQMQIPLQLKIGASSNVKTRWRELTCTNLFKIRIPPLFQDLFPNKAISLWNRWHDNQLFVFFLSVDGGRSTLLAFVLQKVNCVIAICTPTHLLWQPCQKWSRYINAEVERRVPLRGDLIYGYVSLLLHLHVTTLQVYTLRSISPDDLRQWYFAQVLHPVWLFPLINASLCLKSLLPMSLEKVSFYPQQSLTF